MKIKETTIAVPDCTLGELIRWLQSIEACTLTTAATAYGTELKFHGSQRTTPHISNIGAIVAWATAHGHSVSVDVPDCGASSDTYDIILRATIHQANEAD